MSGIIFPKKTLGTVSLPNLWHFNSTTKPLSNLYNEDKQIQIFDDQDSDINNHTNIASNTSLINAIKIKELSNF